MTNSTRYLQHNVTRPIYLRLEGLRPGDSQPEEKTGALDAIRLKADYSQPTKLEALRDDPSVSEKLNPPTTAADEKYQEVNDPGNNPEANQNKNADQCVVEARFNPLGPGYYHGYILTTDRNGSEFFRGGPGRLPHERPDIGKSGTLISGAGGAVSQSSETNKYNSSNSGNSVSAGSGPGGEGESVGLFGSIVVDHGSYDQSAIDWQENKVPSVTVARYDGNCDAIKSKMLQSAIEITESHTPYNPLVSNSNSVAREILENAGHAGVESPVWAPGWHTELESK